MGLGVPMQPITPNLWFDGNAEEAARFYVSVFPDSRMLGVQRYTEAGPGPAGTAVSVEFELRGQRFTGINGGPMFTFSEAVSFVVACDDQEEADHYWAALTADGGLEGQCGWLKDRFGLSWQVYPSALGALLGDPDPVRAAAATRAMLAQRRIDLAEIAAAADAAAAADSR